MIPPPSPRAPVRPRRTCPEERRAGVDAHHAALPRRLVHAAVGAHAVAALCARAAGGIGPLKAPAMAPRGGGALERRRAAGWGGGAAARACGAPQAHAPGSHAARRPGVGAAPHNKQRPARRGRLLQLPRARGDRHGERQQGCCCASGGAACWCVEACVIQARPHGRRGRALPCRSPSPRCCAPCARCPAQPARCPGVAGSHPCTAARGPSWPGSGDTAVAPSVSRESHARQPARRLPASCGQTRRRLCA